MASSGKLLRLVATLVGYPDFVGNLEAGFSQPRRDLFDQIARLVQGFRPSMVDIDNVRPGFEQLSNVVRRLGLIAKLRMR